VKHPLAAAPYAKALFALATERNQAELVGRELGEVAATFESDRDLRDFFARPWIPVTGKRNLAAEVARRSGLSKLTSDFFALVVAHNRGAYLQAMAEKYQQLLDEDLGRVRARIRTAVPLTDDERQTLITKLAHTLGRRQVVLEELVDPTMLGGFVVESGSVVLDGSLEGQLALMRQRLASG
jgi:F-type H+-transporting ATPase subunit delta